MGAMQLDATPTDRQRAIHAQVSGIVQGVGFRYSTQRTARGLGLAGWVRNRPDGSVELWAQGRSADVERLVTYVRRGPRGAQVTTVRVQSVSPKPGLTGFAVTG